jgi:hypothetical protein
MLTTVSENHICDPVHDEETGTLGWTLNQAELIVRIDKMRESGLSMAEIVRLFDAEDGTVDATIDTAYMQTMRKERRGLKRMLLQDQAIKTADEIAGQSGYYLRYLPQRWMALLPLSHNKAFEDEHYLQAAIALSNFAECAGWANAGISGRVTSAPNANEAITFAFTELASQPQPLLVPGSSADSGCYYSFDSVCVLGRTKPNCDTCSMGGRPIMPADKASWQTFADNSDSSNPTILLGSLERPFAEGPWSNLTRKWLERPNDAGALEPSEFASMDSDIIAGRARLMPQLQRLPMNITACVIPAGMYLCRQCDIGEQQNALMEIIGITRVIPHRDMTIAEEKRVISDLADTLGSSFDLRDAGQIDELTGLDGNFPQVADRAQIGWWRPIPDSLLSKLVIPTATALTGEGDFPVMCVNTPTSDVNALPRIEMQVPVDASGVLDSLDGKKRFQGIVASIEKLVHERSTAEVVACRICGTPVEVVPGNSVAVCAQCGAALSVPHIEDPARSQALAQADVQFLSGNFDKAARAYRHASMSDPSDPDQHWMLMLCRYGIRYYEDPQTGCRVPDVTRSLDVPLSEDPDARKALSLADDMQWEVYQRQLQRIETERRKADEADKRLGDISFTYNPNRNSKDGSDNSEN